MPIATIATHWYTVVPALVALFGVLITLIINGIRTERQPRRDLHARGLAAITAYGEMPYRIRRRPPGADQRARLSDELSLVKAEVDICQVLLAADGDERLSDAYDRLYAVARRTLGKAAHDAWKAPVIEDDRDMNQGDLYRQLREFNSARNAFTDDLRAATLPARHRASRAIRRRWKWTTKIPGVRQTTESSERIPTAPQDLACADKVGEESPQRAG
jgi:hypothetical protein